MSNRHRLYIFVLFISLLIPSLACSSLASFTEETTLTIVSPDPEVRIGDEYPADGSPIQTNLSVRMDTNTDRYIPAKIYLNGVAKPDLCNLAPNEITNCGALDLYNQGQQTVKVEIVKLSGEIISAETAFLWEPYIGWDAVALKLARVAGSNSPTIGFYLFGVLFMIVFAGIIGVKNQSGQGVVLGLIVSLAILIIMFLSVSPTVAANIVASIIGLVSTSLIFGVIVYGMSRNYEVARKSSLYITMTDANGNPIVIDAKSSSMLGNSGADTSTAAAIQAALEAASKSGKYLPDRGVEHYVDGQIVSEEQFYLQTGRQHNAVTPQRRGFFQWFFAPKSRQPQNQKRLR